MNASPHESEYLAAVRGLHEQTISQANEPAVGDFVSGMTAGRRWSGRVEWVIESRLTINIGGAWISVPVGDITH